MKKRKKKWDFEGVEVEVIHGGDWKENRYGGAWSWLEFQMVGGDLTPVKNPYKGKLRKKIMKNIWIIREMLHAHFLCP